MSKITTYILWSSFLIAVVAGIFVIAKFANKPASDNTTFATASIANNDWIKGNRNASTTIIEYSDFQCPACGAYYPITKKLVEEFGDTVVFAYRHFPLSSIHKNAELAARAVEAAGKQGKFWDMHDMIFEHQKEWSDQKDAKEFFMKYSAVLGLQEDQFKRDIDSKEVRDKINADYQGGLQLKVNATPTFFLNGKKLQNPRDYKEFKSLIQTAISQQKP